jgi:hypothetical protein
MDLGIRIAARLRRPILAWLDGGIREVARQVANDHGRTGAAELGAVRDELRDLSARLDAMRTELDAARAERAIGGGLAAAGTPKLACTVPGCATPVRSKGLCSAHYQQERRGTLRPLPAANFPGNPRVIAGGAS